MFRSRYHIERMDCPSEERLIRLKLEDLPGISSLFFDLDKRDLIVIHQEEDPEILMRLESLNLGATLAETRLLKDSDKQDSISYEEVRQQRRTLWIVLLINAAFFLIEMTAGFLSDSMGLVADSLDMLADAMVYGMSLMAVGASIVLKKRVSSFAGYIQLFLAEGGFLEVLRRVFFDENLPGFTSMFVISFMAMIANGICLYLLQKTRSQDIHMRASMLFTSNDVIINAGIILAGILVLLTRSPYPDLMVGSIVFIIVLRGSIRILRLRKT